GRINWKRIHLKRKQNCEAMTIEQPILKFTVNPDGLRKFSQRVTEGLYTIFGLRALLGALVLLPVFISKNPIVDAVCASLVVALIGWSIRSMLKLRRTKGVMGSYTIIIDQAGVTVDMEGIEPFSISRSEIKDIQRTEEAFIVKGKSSKDTIIVPRGV